MEYKAVSAEYKAKGDKGEFEGYFSVFNNVDDGGDIIRPGAFKKTIAERGKRIKPYYMHDIAKLLGPAPDVLEEDSTGLLAKGRLTLGNSWARDVWELIKDDALEEGSIGYIPIYDKTDWVDGVRIMKEIELWEYSFVPLGMNALTSVQAVKSLRLDPAAREQSLFGIAMDALAEIKAGRVISASNLEKLRAALVALDEVIKAAEPEASEEDEKAHHSAEPEAAMVHHSRLTALRMRELELLGKYPELSKIIH